MKDITFCLLSNNKMTFCRKSIAFFCLILFLFLEIQIWRVKNSRYKSGFVYIPLVYKPTKKWLRLYIGPGSFTVFMGFLIFSLINGNITNIYFFFPIIFTKLILQCAALQKHFTINRNLEVYERLICVFKWSVKHLNNHCSFHHYFLI